MSSDFGPGARELAEGLAKRSEEQGIPLEKVMDFLARLRRKSLNTVPISIFNIKKLSSLEAITKFLREEKGLTYLQIAELTGRDFGAIGVTYRRAVQKYQGKLDCSSQERFPLHILKDRHISVLEHIVSHLKETGYSFKEISMILNLDQRTVWTAHHRKQVKEYEHTK